MKFVLKSVPLEENWLKMVFGQLGSVFDGICKSVKISACS